MIADPLWREYVCSNGRFGMTSSEYPLHFRDGHLFLEADGQLWLFDTGAPTSFGCQTALRLGGEKLQLTDAYMGMTARTLSDFVPVECTGLLGGDILGQFDFVLDLSNGTNGTVEISSGILEHSGKSVPTDEVIGIPIVAARIGGADYRMFFDTGAQISYFQHDSLVDYPAAGAIADFYPGVGQFQTETHNVDVVLGETEFTLRCGTLPELLAATLMMAGTTGIIGNQVIAGRRIGYFPRRRIVVF